MYENKGILTQFDGSGAQICAWASHTIAKVRFNRAYFENNPDDVSMGTLSRPSIFRDIFCSADLLAFTCGLRLNIS